MAPPPPKDEPTDDVSDYIKLRLKGSVRNN